ncbi:MAG: DUF479 domain-containing protein [Fibrobacter sp.]|nr:DUF479 domain-containing protein [Fibrobacter sp.]
MNYLAHLLLAKPGHHSAIGSLLADFTRIPSGNLHLHFGHEIAEAVILHRKIDSFTDSHIDVAAACHPLFPKYRHWSRIIIDIAFDYFLTKHWDSYSQLCFDAFLAQSYRYLSEIPEGIPTSYHNFAQRLITYDGLRAYSEKKHLKIVFERLQLRVNCGVSIANAWEDIFENHDGIEQRFCSFFPQLVSFKDREISEG